MNSEKLPFKLGISGLFTVLTFVGGFLVHSFTLARNIPSVQDVQTMRSECHAYTDEKVTQAVRTAEDRHQQIITLLEQRYQGCLDHSDLNRKDAGNAILTLAADVRSNTSTLESFKERIVTLEREVYQGGRLRYRANAANFITQTSQGGDLSWPF